MADPGTDIVKVASVGTSGADGTGITLASPLTHPHAAAATVQDVQDSGHLLFSNTTDTADWHSLPRHPGRAGVLPAGTWSR